MKNTLLSMITLFVLLTLLLAGCTPPTTPSATPVEMPTVEEKPISTIETAPAVTPDISPTPAPTETLPIPCMIAFDSYRDGNREIYVMGPDGKDPYNISNNPGDDSDPSWSPDGTQIAFVSNRENGGKSGQFIYVVNADGSNVRQLSLENDSREPDWSHDGRMITYTSNDDIYSIAADGSGTSVNLTNSPEKDRQPSWSPDGKQIVWLTGNDGNWNIKTMDADGSDVSKITHDGKVTDAVWTVDGQIFTHWDNKEAGCFNCVMDADGSNVKDAGGKGTIQQYLPFWTLKGDRVECVSANLNGNDNEIYLVGEIFPGIFLNLTNNPADDSNPDWPANCGSGKNSSTSETQQPQDTGEIVIGYAGDQKWQNQRKNNFQRACTELGIQCVYGDLPELVEGGVSAIVQNTDAIVVKGLHEDILKARDKGIPVFLLDAETITDGAYSLTIDQKQWLKSSLGWMLEKMGGKGEIAYFDLHPFVRYADNINDILSGYPEVKVVEYRDGKYNPEKIKPESVDFLRTHPELKGLWTSYNMSEAIRGLVESRIPYEQWPVLVCDATMEGLDTWQKVKEKYPDFECVAVPNPPGIAYDAVYAAYYLISGKQIDESALGGAYGHSLYVPFSVITDSSLPDWLKTVREDGGTYVDERMSPEEILEKWFK